MGSKGSKGGGARKTLDSRFPVLNFPIIAHLTANDKDFSAMLSMTIRESNVSSHQSLVTSLPPSL